MTPKEPISVLLADDHTLVRQGLRALLEREPGIDVVAEAADGHEALELAERLRPQVAVIDISMPRLSGLEVARRLARLGVRVILLSMYKSSEYARQAAKAHVYGYILKENAAYELVEAIHKVARGEYHFASAVLARLLEEVRSGGGPPEETKLELLTPREREVLQLIAEGHTNEEIARLIHRSVETIRSHRASIMRKLGLHSVAELVRFALEEGLLPSPSAPALEIEPEEAEKGAEEGRGRGGRGRGRGRGGRRA